MITTTLCYSATSGSSVADYGTPCTVDMGNVGYKTLVTSTLGNLFRVTQTVIDRIPRTAGKRKIRNVLDSVRPCFHLVLNTINFRGHHSSKLDDLDQFYRNEDSKQNADTTPPEDEFIDLSCAWAVEFYTPAHIDSLVSAFSRLGWDHEDGGNLSNDPAAWLKDLRQRQHGGAWLNLGIISSNVID